MWHDCVMQRTRQQLVQDRMQWKKAVHVATEPCSQADTVNQVHERERERERDREGERGAGADPERVV